VALIGWTTGNYQSINSTVGSTIFNSIKVIFCFVIIQNAAYFLFVNTFPNSEIRLQNKYVKAYVLISGILVILALLGVFFAGYAYDGNNFELKPSPLIALFLTHAIFSIFGGIGTLWYRLRQASGVVKNQLLYLIFASVLLMVVVPLTNFLLPLFLNNNMFVQFSPIYTLLFASIIGYAIVRQKLFDIRLIVARSVAYILILATITSIYTGSVFVVSSLIFHQSFRNREVELITYVLLAVILAFTFQSIRRFIDRATNELFYRDTYDTQSVLDKLGDIIVGNISTHKIEREALDILKSAVQPTYMTFLMLDSAKKLSLAGVEGERWQSGDSEPLQAALKKIGDEIVVEEELEEGNNLKDILRKEEINLAIALITTNKTIGYLVAGPKKSGNPYTSQDKGLINIAANELAIALQNAQRFEEIQAFNETLQDKIGDATRELKSTNKKLVELDEAKDEFISMASHQLRTPLTSIKGYISMMIEGDMGKLNDQQKTALKEAFTSSQRMVFLIADFLNVSRIKTGACTT
jgi:signal transduction histidine kinase